MEVSIYKLQSQPFSKAFPRLLETISERNISTVVYCQDESNIKQCDMLLWSFDQTSFLTHSVKGETNILPQKIYITDNHNDNPYLASVLAFYNTSLDIEPSGFSKVVYMLSKEENILATELLNKFLKIGLKCTVFEQNSNGGWTKLQ